MLITYDAATYLIFFSASRCIFFSRVGIEPTTCRVYSHALVRLRLNTYLLHMVNLKYFFFCLLHFIFGLLNNVS